MAGNQLQIISRFNIECHCFENIKTQYWLFVCNYASHQGFSKFHNCGPCQVFPNDVLMLLALCPRLCPRWPILGTPCLGQTFSFPAFTTTFVVKKILRRWTPLILQYISSRSIYSCKSQPSNAAGGQFIFQLPPRIQNPIPFASCLFWFGGNRVLNFLQKRQKKYLCPKRAIIAFIVFNRVAFDWTSIQSKDSKLFCSEENLRNCKFPPDNTK